VVPSAAQPGLDQERAELVAVQPKRVGLIVDLRATDVGSRVAVDDGLLGAVPVEATDRRQPSTDRRAGEAVFFGPAGVELDVGPLDAQDVDAVAVEPGHPLAQVEPVGVERRAGVAGQVAGDRALRELPPGVELDGDEVAGGWGVERTGERGADHRDAPVEAKGQPAEHHTTATSR